MRLATFVVLAAGAAHSAAQVPLPKMTLDLQSLDGNAQDIAGPSSVAGVDPKLQRVWFSQGRKRTQINVDNRQRQIDEEDLGYQYESKMSSLANDPMQDRLFTLLSRRVIQGESGPTTIPAKVTVDLVADQTSPITLQTLTFPDHIDPVSISTSPDQDHLLVVLRDVTDDNNPVHWLRLYDYSSGVLASTFSQVQLPGGQTICSGATTNTMTRAQVARIDTGSGDQWVALVVATVKDTGCSPGKPQPNALLFCNIDTPSAPFFYTDFATQVWQPCRQPPTSPCSEFRINGMTHLGTNDPSPKDLIYVVGGSRAQLHVLDVTDIENTPISASPPLLLFGGDNLFAIEADPDAPTSSDYLYVVGRNATYVIDRPSLQTTPIVATTPVGFGNGPAGTPLFMIDPDGAGVDRREFWTLAMQNATYPFRVTDFTQSPSPGLEAPDASEGYYTAGPTDGAVANFDWDSAYLPTFGGVVRWDLSGADPIPLPDSYQPAEDPVTLVDYITEHIFFDDMGPGPVTSGWHVLTGTAGGNFFTWPLDPITRDPLPGREVTPPASYWPSSWNPNKTYGTDIITADHPITGTKWVLFDHYLRDIGPGELGEIGIGRYNWTSGGWAPAMTWQDTGTSPEKITPQVLALAVEDKWLFVAAEGGFLCFDLQNGLCTDEVYVNKGDVCGYAYDQVLGIEAYINGTTGDSWVFASLGGDEHGFALARYAFDSTSGTIVDPVTGNPSDSPVQCLFDGTGGDDFPGPYVREGGRLSFVELDNDPVELRIYSATQNGNTLEVEFAGGTLTPLSYWHNGAFSTEIQNCHAYKVMVGTEESIRVVVAKTQETFEVVIPPDMP